MTHRVTIYIPTRNRRPLLERAISSVRQQTYDDIEIIVVDDCSNDDTQEFLCDLARQEQRLVALHMEMPCGASAARNRAIASATGHFITGLDDDDEFRADRIALFLSQWTSMGSTADATSCLFTESVLTDGITSEVTSDRKDHVSYFDLFRHNFIGNQVFCPRERLLIIGGYDESMPAWEDLEMFMRLIKRYGEARRLQDPTYTYYVERGRERISACAERQHLAFRKIVEKNTDVPAEFHHQLFLELFSPFYGTVPTFSDWRTMLGWGARPQLLARLLRASIRNRLRHSTSGMSCPAQ